LEDASVARLGTRLTVAGGAIRAGADEVYERPRLVARECKVRDFVRGFVVGEGVRDYRLNSSQRILFPYDNDARSTSALDHTLWPFKTTLAARATFQGVMADAGLRWTDYMQFTRAPYETPLTLCFAFIATHNHFILDRGGNIFNKSAPVLKLDAAATELEYLDLLGLLNSSTACFWLKQVCHRKGGGLQSGGGEADQPWSWIHEFTGTKLQEFPMPAHLPRERARRLDALAQRAALSLPAEALDGDVSRAALGRARETWGARRAQMVFEQEELDWEVYRAYGLTDEDLTYSGDGIGRLALGERAFEIGLARLVAEGSEDTAWFERHGSTPISNIPAEWPEDYRALVHKRLDLIESDPFIGLLERPEYKRRWQSATWDDMLPEALQSFILDRLEEPALWSDASGPGVLSIAQLADRVRGDADLVEAMRLLRDAVEVDLTKELGKLLADEAVPFLAALRYKDSGMRKREEWEAVWDLQRREDAGERVSIPVPPKYGSGDFHKACYWKARGKLDVPKERFISYPGAGRPGDSSMVIGWAGWDHLDQARALARLIVERTQGEGMAADQVLPLVAGLVELEPWLHQWHAEPDAAFGGMSPATFLSGFIDSQLAALGATRTDAKAWRP
jgi:hypothetical protein